MIEFKQSTIARVAVRLLDSTGSPVAGAGFGTISATIEKSDGTTGNMTMSGSNWIEVTSGAFSGLGKYDLLIPATLTDTTGILVFAVTGPSSSKFIGICKIVANEEVDTFSRLGAPAGASISADIASVKTTVTSTNTIVTDVQTDVDELQVSVGTVQTTVTDIQTTINTLKKYEQGRWKIFTSGPDANRLVIYDTDGTTPLIKFDLKNSAGGATSIEPFERVPV
jgi:hypothetical protein